MKWLFRTHSLHIESSGVGDVECCLVELGFLLVLVEKQPGALGHVGGGDGAGRGAPGAGGPPARQPQEVKLAADFRI